MLSAGFGLACLGIVLLSLSLKRHYLQLWPQNKNFRWWSLLCRTLGYVAVAASLLPCIKASGLWIGLVLWTSLLAGAAFLQAMVLTYRPKHSLWFAVASLAMIAVGLAFP